MSRWNAATLWTSAHRQFTMTFMPVMGGGVGGLSNIMGTAFWPRAILLRADLAAAAKQQDEARIWYSRVLDLWADADAELQPVIARIRTSLASLGPPRG